jgi:outer membrane protein
MKQLTKAIFVLSIFSVSVAAKAQTPKFGHINSADLIQLMPETKQSDSTLRKFGESLDGQLKTMTAEYQSKLQRYQTSRDSMPDAIKAVKEKELEDLGNRIQDFQQTAQESIQKKKEDIYGPILKKADQAIKDVAKEKGYTYIFDTSAGTVLYAEPSDDIIGQVKTKMGLK